MDERAATGRGCGISSPIRVSSSARRDRAFGPGDPPPVAVDHRHRTSIAWTYAKPDSRKHSCRCRATHCPAPCRKTVRRGHASKLTQRFGLMQLAASSASLFTIAPGKCRAAKRPGGAQPVRPEHRSWDWTSRRSLWKPKRSGSPFGTRRWYPRRGRRRPRPFRRISIIRFCRHFRNGARRFRTDDLLLANYVCRNRAGWSPRSPAPPRTRPRTCALGPRFGSEPW